MAGVGAPPGPGRTSDMARPTLRTPICDLLDIEYPVVLAGMGGVATADLVAAVSDAGGLGIVGAATMTGEEIAEQVRRIRGLTSRPFGVDILLPAGVVSPSRPEDGGDAPPRNPRDLLPPEHREFVLKAREHFGLPEEGRSEEEITSRLAAMTGDFTRRQVEAIIDLKVPVFA